MNYELAKKLYKAGFPGIKCSEENPTPGYTYPTLSELIEACGGYFEALTPPMIGGKIGWVAWNLLPRITGGKDRDGRTFSNGIGRTGKTPEEAVANLWLKLNEKKE